MLRPSQLRPALNHPHYHIQPLLSSPLSNPLRVSTQTKKPPKDSPWSNSASQVCLIGLLNLIFLLSWFLIFLLLLRSICSDMSQAFKRLQSERATADNILAQHTPLKTLADTEAMKAWLGGITEAAMVCCCLASMEDCVAGS